MLADRNGEMYTSTSVDIIWYQMDNESNEICKLKMISKLALIDEYPPPNKSHIFFNSLFILFSYKKNPIRLPLVHSIARNIVRIQQIKFRDKFFCVLK